MGREEKGDGHVVQPPIYLGTVDNDGERHFETQAALCGELRAFADFESAANAHSPGARHGGAIEHV